MHLEGTNQPTKENDRRLCTFVRRLHHVLLVPFETSSTIPQSAVIQSHASILLDVVAIQCHPGPSLCIHPLPIPFKPHIWASCILIQGYKALNACSGGCGLRLTETLTILEDSRFGRTNEIVEAFERTPRSTICEITGG